MKLVIWSGCVCVCVVYVRLWKANSLWCEMIVARCSLFSRMNGNCCWCFSVVRMLGLRSYVLVQCKAALPNRREYDVRAHARKASFWTIPCHTTPHKNKVWCNNAQIKWHRIASASNDFIQNVRRPRCDEVMPHAMHGIRNSFEIDSMNCGL